MQCRVDIVISKVRIHCALINIIYIFPIVKVQEHHRKYLEEGTGSRDVLIVAHGHFNRVFISRWLESPLAIGKRCLISRYV